MSIINEMMSRIFMEVKGENFFESRMKRACPPSRESIGRILNKPRVRFVFKNISMQEFGVKYKIKYDIAERKKLTVTPASVIISSALSERVIFLRSIMAISKRVSFIFWG